MKGKILFVAGLGTGYVLGTRAGRARYEQLTRVARSVWNSAPVQTVSAKAGAFVNAKAPEVVEFIADAVRKAAAKKKDAAKSANATKRTSDASSNRSSGADGDALQGHSTS